VTRTEAADLAAWAEGRLPQLVGDACAAILDRIPVYHGDQVVPPEDLRQSVTRNLRFIVVAVGHPQEPPDLAVPRETGRRCAHQGVPLPELLQACRISSASLWDALVEHVRRRGQPPMADTLLTVASMIWRLTDEYADAVIEAYQVAVAELPLAQQHRRSALVEALLTWHQCTEAVLREAAALLGVPAGAQLMVVAAEAQGLAGESLPGIEWRLADRGIVSGWRLTPALQLGVVSLHADQRDIVLTALRGVASARTGVSPPYRSMTETPRAAQLARSALAAIPAGRAEVLMFSPGPLDALMACRPAQGRRIASEVLGAVLRLPPDDRAILLETLNVYVDQAGSASRAAGVLYCHPNTVRYRLRRLQELTGRSLSDPGSIAELAAAARALRVNSGAAPRSAERHAQR
jgi:hypothetical protein